MKQVLDEQMVKILSELAELLHQVYADNTDLKKYEDKLSDVSTDIALKYLKVFSIIDVSYAEYKKWKDISPFYKNVSEEGVIIYAA